MLKIRNPGFAILPGYGLQRLPCLKGPKRRRRNQGRTPMCLAPIDEKAQPAVTGGCF
jgi:hypothetical protein